MAFKPEEFIEDVTWETFDKLRRYIELDIKQAMRKQVIKNALIDVSVGDDLLDEKYLDKKMEVQIQVGVDVVKLKQLEMQQEIEMQKLKIVEQESMAKLKMEEAKLKMEEEKLKMEEGKLKMEEEFRVKELEMKMSLEHEKLKQELAFQEKKLGEKKKKFDVTKYIKLVPKFNECEVDKYFLHFEKIANSLSWPTDQWCLLLQSVLVGKAMEVFSSLPVDAKYPTVKQSILNAYELVPEAYRQKFRNTRKTELETHLEFARSKEVLLDRWLLSKEVAKDYENLRQLLLIEEFKRCVHSDIKTYLDENKLKTLNEAATMADEYALTHKARLGKPHSNSNFYRGSGRSTQGEKVSSTEVRDTKSTEVPSDSKKQVRANNENKPKSGPSCYHCKKKGHLMSQCWKLHGKPSSTPVACAAPVRINESLPSEDQKVIQKESDTIEVSKMFEPFMLEGLVSLDDKDSPQAIKIVRDTCCARSMILEGTLPFSEDSQVGHALIRGVGMEVLSVPLHRINLTSTLVSGPITIGVRQEWPVEGISMLLGNDLAGEKVFPDPIMTDKPCLQDDGTQENDIYPACAVTRAMSKQASLEAIEESRVNDQSYDLEDTFLTKSEGEQKTPDPVQIRDSKQDPLNHNKLIFEQENDPEISILGQRALTPQEAEQSPVCFYKQNEVLMRKWRPPDAQMDEEWRVVHQIVIPKVYRNDIISIAHDTPMAGHLGVKKTYDRILQHFWWPSLKKDVAEYCKTCHPCQMVGKPNQKIPSAPLKPIPAFEEPFSRVLIDCVGPLPKTKSGNQYLLTIMCASTRFPEAIPLRNIKAPQIVKALTKFFTLVGLPKEIQSDQGSNFMSGIFQQVMQQLGIKQFKSSAYHPESQGALERFHQTLKNMIKTYCYEFERDWDEGVHLLLFAAREAVQTSLGFSPFELVFGHSVRGPLKLLKERWLSENTDLNLLDYVVNFKQRLFRATEIAHDNLKQSQEKMKTWYDKGSRNRVFEPGDKVLALFPIQGQPLQARYTGPYEIDSKVGEVNYIVKPQGDAKQNNCVTSTC
ncbi:uncharacterized protein [Amphiura filiformis]|uniref:uncharacterized protein n=1 Tax=Amphiura filiformis TaxID=82378 RepID=UPI003B21C976